MGQKSKRVTWAPDVNLCQVRLFSSTQSPSEVGTGTQHRLHRKASLPVELNDSLPPGFEDFKSTNARRVKLPQIPLAKWRCPPRFEVSSNWNVVSGEESKELEYQKQRERRVLRAIYLHPLAIPPNPHLPVKESSISDDHYIPLIRTTVIEDEIAELAELASSVSQAAENDSTPMIPQPQHLPNANGVVPMQPDTVVTEEAVRASLASVLSNLPKEDQRNLIDCDLLIRILRNPQELQKYMTNMKSQPKNPPDSTASISINTQTTKPQQNAAPPTVAAEAVAPPTIAAAAVAPQHRTGFNRVTSAPSPYNMVKDVNYYKSLIQQHGRGGGGGVPARSTPIMMRAAAVQIGLKPRKMKPCMYVNSSKGCKNGANCAYQHDMFSSRKRAGFVTQVFGAKRVKLT